MAKDYKEKFNDEDGVWRTVGGRRIFIKNGQNLSDAMKESGKFKSAKKQETEEEKEKEKSEKVKVGGWSINEQGKKEYNERELGDDERGYWTKENGQRVFKENPNYKEKTLNNYSKYTADEQDILDRFGEDYGYDKGDNLKNLKGQIDYMRNPNESIHRTAERLVEGGDFLIYNGDIKDWLDERKIKYNEDNFFDVYKNEMADKIEELYNNNSINNSLRQKAYQKYMKEHPNSKKTFSDFMK